MKLNFAGVPEEFAKKDISKIAILPANANVNAFFNASNNIETYDIETDSEVYKQGIYISNYATENLQDLEDISNAVYTKAKDLLKTNKFVATIAQEHVAAIGTIKAYNEHFKNLTVLHIDAHARLHKQINGNTIANHCALYQASQTTNLIQLGIRSMSAIEKTVIDSEKTFFAHNIATDDYWMENLLDTMTDNVLISFSLEGLDASLMPSVEKSLPGGLFWYETLELLKTILSEKNVVGVNLLGLKPIENNNAPDILAASLLYKMFSYQFADTNEDTIEDETIFTSKENRLSKFQEEEYSSY